MELRLAQTDRRCTLVTPVRIYNPLWRNAIANIYPVHQSLLVAQLTLSFHLLETTSTRRNTGM